MKICFVFGLEPWFLPPALEMRKALQAQGHQVEVVYVELHGVAPEEGDIEKPALVIVRKRRGWGRLLAPLDLGLGLKRVLQKNAFDVVICCDPVALQALMLFSGERGALIGYWGFEPVYAPSEYRPSMDKLRALLFRGWLQRIDFFLAPSKTRADVISELANHKLPFAVILNCRALAPPQATSSSSVADTLRKARGFKVRLVHAGRISTTQYVDEIVAALALLPVDTALLIAGIGDPIYIGRLQATAERLGVASRIFFLGRLSRSDTYMVLDNADIGLVFYDGRADGGANDPAPNKIGDYIASGLHMIGSTSDYISHWLNDQGAGVCVNEVTAQTIADAASRLITTGRCKDRQLIQKIFREEMNMDLHADKLLRLIEDVRALGR